MCHKFVQLAFFTNHSEEQDDEMFVNQVMGMETGYTNTAVLCIQSQRPGVRILQLGQLDIQEQPPKTTTGTE